MLTLREAVQILGINSMDFTEKDLLNGYRIAARKYHTDLNPDAQSEKMYKVNEAHTILKEYLKNKSETINTNSSREKKYEDPYKEQVTEYAKKFDLSYPEARYRYDTYKKRTNYTGSIIDYYENLITKYYKNKDLIFSLYNEIRVFNGSLTYIIDEYEDNNKDKSVSIIEWLQNKVSEKRLSEILNINIKELVYAYQNDQTYGYKNTFNEYIKELYSFIATTNLKEINYNFIKANYKREISNGKNKAFIDYLKIKLQIELLKRQTDTNSDELLYRVFEILNNNNSLNETVEELKGKVFKKTKF